MTNNNKWMVLVLALAATAAATTAQASLIVSPSDNASTLTNSILGSGVTLIGTPSYTGATNASGTFSGGNSAGIGIDKGLLLTSGSVNTAVGPNNQNGAGAANGVPGDSDLDMLVPGTATHDASSLQFNFTTKSGKLFFNYVFASEEYNEFVNSQYNDVFGFFLDGKNIALVPGTSTPVAINNVNCGNPYNAPSGGMNCSSFKNNPSNGGAYSTQYDGLTDVFTAKALGLGAGTHTIKLAIADTSDFVLDSGVFVQANSFSGMPPNVPEPGSLFVLAASLIGLGAVLRRRGRA